MSSISDADVAKLSGVRRLNKKPLLIFGIGMIIVVAVLLNAIAAKGRAQKNAATKPADNAALVRTVDSKSSVVSLTKDIPDGMITEKYERPVSETDEVKGEIPAKESPPAVPGIEPKNLSATSAASGKQREVSLFSNNPQGSKQDPEVMEAKEELKRKRDQKRQLYEQALQSPTTVNYSQGSQEKKTDDPTAQLAALLGAGAGHQGIDMNSQLSRLAASLGVTGDTTGQESKKRFLADENTGKYGYLTAERTAAISPYEVKTGTIIPAVLITEVNSDLPGMIIGQVAQNVYDTATGKHLLIPQGTKIIGSYDSMVSYGQSRALIAWNKLSYPDASSLFVGSMSGADQAGAAGFKDKVNNHFVKLFGSAAMLSLFSAGAQLSQPESNSPYPTARETAIGEMGKEIAQVGQEIIRKQMTVQPTIIIRSGYRFNVMINKDIILAPYKPLPPRMATTGR